MVRGRPRRGVQKYATNRETFQLGMGGARPPLRCLAAASVAFICCQWHMRYRALNHVAPGSGENYLCCQGYLPACLCFQPGHCGRQRFPRTCMCLEACLCPGLPVVDPLPADGHVPPRGGRVDNASFASNACKFCPAFARIAMFNRNFRHLARLLDLIAEIVFCDRRLHGCPGKRRD